jgi:hypothetical protein
VLREIHYAKGEGRHIAPWASKGRKNMQAGRQAGRHFPLGYLFFHGYYWTRKNQKMPLIICCHYLCSCIKKVEEIFKQGSMLCHAI